MRLQAASRDPTAYAALAAQAALPNYGALLGQVSGNNKASSDSSKSTATPPPSSGSPASFDSLKLPSDTEIIKYTSSATGSRNPGNSNRGRKKTISLDQQANQVYFRKQIFKIFVFSTFESWAGLKLMKLLKGNGGPKVLNSKVVNYGHKIVSFTFRWPPCLATTKPDSLRPTSRPG